MKLPPAVACDSPVHSWRKFSHVRGVTSAFSSISMVPMLPPPTLMSKKTVGGRARVRGEAGARQGVTVGLGTWDRGLTASGGRVARGLSLGGV